MRYGLETTESCTDTTWSPGRNISGCHIFMSDRASVPCMHVNVLTHGEWFPKSCMTALLPNTHVCILSPVCFCTRSSRTLWTARRLHKNLLNATCSCLSHLHLKNSQDPRSSGLCALGPYGTSQNDRADRCSKARTDICGKWQCSRFSPCSVVQSRS
jgi:hypothetical protein